MAPRKGAGTSLAKYDAELAAMLEQGKKVADQRAGNVTQAIGTKGGRFSIDGKVIKDDKLDLVIVGSILHNAFYKEAFDPENPTTPDCYAFGEDKETMAPDQPNVPDRQSEQCAGCPHLEWGSAGGGSKGKACKETVKLVTISADDVADGPLAAPERTLSVPPTSGAAFAAYTDDVADEVKLPVAAVITQVEIGPGKNGTGHMLDFSMVEAVDKGFFGEIVEKHKKVMKTIDADYPPKEDQGKARGKRGSTPAKGGRGAATPARGGARTANGGQRTTTARKY